MKDTGSPPQKQRKNAFVTQHHPEVQKSWQKSQNLSHKSLIQQQASLNQILKNRI